MHNSILAELEQERAEIQMLIEQCYHEIKACKIIYESTGDGSQKWRAKFDERFHLMRQLKAINVQIEEARREILAVGSPVEILFNDQPSGRSVVQAIHEARPMGRIISMRPITEQSFPLAFAEDGRCVIRGFEDFTFRPVCEIAHSRPVARQAA